jgi:hypothetical protein
MANVTSGAMSKLDSAVRTSLALGFAVVLSAVANAAEVPTYKCVESTGSVLYTDMPCKGGQLLDIRAGASDPAAVQRLEQAQAAFDRYAAQRATDAQIESARREELSLLREEEAARMAADAATTYTDNNYALAWGSFPAFVRHPFHRHRPARMPMSARVIHKPPMAVPQR